jgi:hypothetical protein
MTARRVGIVTSLDWMAEPPEVSLPDALVDLAVSQHHDVVVGDAVGYVRGWWVPHADGSPVFLTPADPLIPGDCGVLMKAA